MDYNLIHNIQMNSYFCPRCHLATFTQHPSYREYNKCPSCGYMELMSQTVERIKCKLTDNIDCGCKFVCEKAINMQPNSDNIKVDNDCNNSCACTCNNQSDNKPMP